MTKTLEVPESRLPESDLPQTRSPLVTIRYVTLRPAQQREYRRLAEGLTEEDMRDAYRL